MVAAAGLIHSASSFQTFVDMKDYTAKANSANFAIQVELELELSFSHIPRLIYGNLELKRRKVIFS